MAYALRVVPALLAILSVGTNTRAQTADRRPALEVVLHNRAPLSAVELGTARMRAQFMFDEAGIRLTFLTQAQSGGIARAGFDPIHLVLIDEAAEKRLIAPDRRRLGFAMPTANRVYVQYDRVYALARRHRVAPGWFLGVVIAHELSHVLLPRAAHANDGVMADWLNPDTKSAHAFTNEHAQQMRLRLGGELTLAHQ